MSGRAILLGLLLGLPMAIAASPAVAAESTVYLARRGWHIDVGLAAADLVPPLTEIQAHLPQARYVFFGFGDRRYLLATKHDAPMLFAALWPGSGILLVTGIAGLPDQAFGGEQVIKLTLNSAQMSSLQTFILSSLQVEGDAPSFYRDGPYEDSAFFLALPKYSALHTCNTWAARALQSAGLRVRAGGVVFAGQLWSQALRLQHRQAERASLLIPAF